MIRARKPVRYFRPDPVPKATLEDVLAVVGTAPSNFNSQPWRVHVLTGEPKRALGEAMLAAHVAATVPSFTPFPEAMPAETAARVGEFGRRLYSAMGVDRADAIALSARQRPQLRVLRRARRADLHHRRRAHQPQLARLRAVRAERHAGRTFRLARRSGSCASRR